MKLTPGGGRTIPAGIILVLALLLNACSTIKPTPDLLPTETPGTEVPPPSPTVVQNLNPVFGEQATRVVPTPTAFLIQTSTPSSTPQPSETALPTDTPSPTATATVPVIWGAGIPVPAEIDHFKGYWLSFQQMMVGNLTETAGSGAVSLSPGPRFIPEPLTEGVYRGLGSEFTSSPNGRWILFGANALDDNGLALDEFSTLTRLNIQDRRSTTLLSDLGSLRWISFYGWLDGNLAAISDYAGGGFYNYSIVDIANNSLVSRVQVHGPAWRPNSAYLPMAEEYGGPYRLFVLGRAAQSSPYDTLLGPNVYTRGFPTEYIPTDMNAIYKGWLPDANRMLVQAFIYSRAAVAITHSQLMLWSVDTGNVQVVVQGAIDGVVAPDGNKLAFVTMNPAPLTPDGQPSFDFGLQVPQSSRAYLQLMDLNTRRVSFSLPVVTTITRSTAYTLDVYDTPVRFSPDSRYIAFLTPGLLLTDQTGSLVVLPVSQETAPYLSVLDLSSFQPLLSTPLRTNVDFYFSPTSDRLTFLGKEGNWYLLRLPTSQVLPLTAGGAERLEWNGWSYDGYYFSFYESGQELAGRTYILGPIP